MRCWEMDIAAPARRNATTPAISFSVRATPRQSARLSFAWCCESLNLNPETAHLKAVSALF